MKIYRIAKNADQYFLQALDRNDTRVLSTIVEPFINEVIEWKSVIGSEYDDIGSAYLLNAVLVWAERCKAGRQQQRLIAIPPKKPSYRLETVEHFIQRIKSQTYQPIGLPSEAKAAIHQAVEIALDRTHMDKDTDTEERIRQKMGDTGQFNENL